MRLSVPIFRLKRQAKLLSRENQVPLNEALDRVARDEGFQSWSLLAAAYGKDDPARKILHQLVPGDMVLVGARPEQGKTVFAMKLLLEAVNAGHETAFFTLAENEEDVLARLRTMGPLPKGFDGAFAVDASDAISADYMIDRLWQAKPGTVVGIDYLQLLDERRENPDLAVQASQLKAFAKKVGVILVFLAQIDRRFTSAAKELPGRSDIRLPNPVDLRLFNKACFLNKGELCFEAAA